MTEISAASNPTPGSSRRLVGLLAIMDAPVPWPPLSCSILILSTGYGFLFVAVLLIPMHSKPVSGIFRNAGIRAWAPRAVDNVPRTLPFQSMLLA